MKESVSKFQLSSHLCEIVSIYLDELNYSIFLSYISPQPSFLFLEVSDDNRHQFRLLKCSESPD